MQTTGAPLSSYIFSQAYPGERERLEAMARLWDPQTLRAVSALGIGAGHRCLEAGAGTGSVARALAALVGGYVLAADRDLRFLDVLPEPAEARQLDLMTDDLPAAQFDLVHGWLLTEEVDWTWADVVVPDAPAHVAMVQAMRGVLGQAGGFDSTYGRRLLGDVLSLGFGNVSASYHGSSPAAPVRPGWPGSCWCDSARTVSCGPAC
jgi:SAM-dependent methyltransferase